jgi:glycosyltransferase involved in cell wall biosynthesis
MKRKILFLPLYNEDWASSKYRVYKHIPYLMKHDLSCLVLRPASPTLRSRFHYYARLFLHARRYDIVFIQKKIFRFPLYRLIRMIGKKIVFDFDDAIYCDEPHREEINRIIATVDHVLVANDQLAAYAIQYNRLVTVLPTPLEASPPSTCPSAEDGNVKIAWIGRPWNQHYLSDLEGVFLFLKKTALNLTLYVVSGAPFRFKNTDFPIVYVPWSEKKEEEILRSVNLGIVPLRDDEWSRGKCGYKVLLYMSHGLPVIASPVGVKATLIKNGINGFLASSEQEWIDKLCLLSKDQDLRCKIGASGYETFLSTYTYDVVSARLASILQSI